MIHCADLHLDSPLSSNFDAEKAAQRRNELVRSFSDLADRAQEEGAEAMLISGDLFDGDHVSASAAATVTGVIEAHPEITFFYLRGNHDRSGAFARDGELPPNLRMFGPQWTTYRMHPGEGRADICVTGAEISGDGSQELYDSLRLDADAVNIVMLHGQLVRHGSGGTAVSAAELENKNIDYLALGHIHSYQEGPLPPRGVYCYPGCLEGRGFDECGDHGFVLLDIDPRARTVSHTFVPFAKRRFFEIPVDISGCRATYEMQGRILTELRKTDCTEDDMVKVVLTGTIGAECEKNIPFLQQYLDSLLYLVKIYDNSRISVDYSRYALDASLKGEFVRMVQNDPELPEQEKTEIIRCGFLALNEEELSL